MAFDLDINSPNWQLASRVLNSATFEKSPRLRSFLRFVCELELTGRHQEINEYQIGIQVFGRPAAYNPGEDSIVRSQARFLRQRLEEYFRTEGKNEATRIVIPKGSYIPVFEPNPLPAVEPAPAPTPAPAPLLPQPVIESTPSIEPPAPQPFHRAARGRIVALVAALMFAVLGSLGFLALRSNLQLFQSPETRFWNQLFHSGRQPVIVPADSTLILIEEITGQAVSFQSYLSRDYLANLSLPKCITTLSSSDLDSSHYTSMADLNLVARVLQETGGKGMHATIRYARDLSISEAKEENLLLIGGPRANPWVELFATHMNFYVDYDWKAHRNFVVNKAPLKGESPTYIESATATPHEVYGLISFQPGLNGEGDALLVAGTSSAGTQSAVDFLLSGSAFSAFLRKVERKDGSISHFELLLEARSVGGNVPTSSVVAYRIAP
jgi:hypothetical protein